MNYKLNIRIIFILHFLFFLLITCCERKEKLLQDHYKKGLSYGANSQFTEAKIEFEKALEIDSLSWYIEADLTVIQDFFEGSIKEETAIHLFKSLLLDEKKMYDEEIKELNKAIEIDTNYAILYNKRGIVYYKQRKYQLSISDYNKAISIDPDNPIFYYNIAITFDDIGDKKHALNNYRLFIKKAKNKYKNYRQFSQWRIVQLEGFTI